jgi:hypothetical protein
MFAMMFGSSTSVPTSDVVAAADVQAEAADDVAEPGIADVPLPPHRPRHLGRTLTANR